MHSAPRDRFCDDGTPEMRSFVCAIRERSAAPGGGFVASHRSKFARRENGLDLAGSEGRILFLSSFSPSFLFLSFFIILSLTSLLVVSAWQIFFLSFYFIFLSAGRGNVSQNFDALRPLTRCRCLAR